MFNNIWYHLRLWPLSNHREVTSLMSLQCLRQYVQLAIRGGAGSAITCPDPACKNTGTLLDSEVLLSVSLSPSVSVNNSFQLCRSRYKYWLCKCCCLHWQQKSFLYQASILISTIILFILRVRSLFKSYILRRGVLLLF